MVNLSLSLSRSLARSFARSIARLVFLLEQWTVTVMTTTMASDTRCGDS